MVHNAVNNSVSHKRSRQSLCDAVASTSYQKPFPAEVKKLGFFELDLAANECRKSIEGSRWRCAPLRKAKKHQCFLTNLILWIPYVDLLGDSTVFRTFRIQYPQ